MYSPAAVTGINRALQNHILSDHHNRLFIASSQPPLGSEKLLQAQQYIQLDPSQHNFPFLLKTFEVRTPRPRQKEVNASQIIMTAISSYLALSC